MIVSNNCINIRLDQQRNVSISQLLWCKKLVFYVCLLLVFFLISDAAIAADSLTVNSEPGSISQILNLVLGLIIVLIIFFCVTFLLKRVSGMNGISSGYMKVIDALHLSARERIVLVKVADIYMLLGISSGGINALHVITEPFPKELESSQSNVKTRFQEMLSMTKLKNS